VIGTWEWLEYPGISIPPEITKITGNTDAMVADHHIDDRAVNDLLSQVVLIIAHDAEFDRRFLEKRHPGFSTKHWACSRFDIDWRAEGVRSSALEFVAYSLGFFHDSHRATSDCRATVHALAQRLPGSGRLALQKGRGYDWSPGESGRPRCWYRDVSDADKATEVAWLRENVMRPEQAL
jgi:DNA polymerase III subunit epsilon